MDDQVEKPRGELTTRTLAMPADTNPSGDIFGGWVLAQMDISGGIFAGQRAQGRVATVAVHAMKFIRPVYVGDVMCVYCSLAREGRTSMAVNVEAWALRGRIGERVKVTEGLFTFVAIDQEGRPRPLPERPAGSRREPKADASAPSGVPSAVAPAPSK
jgi:acyl-CoA thioesterase YciA